MSFTKVSGNPNKIDFKYDIFSMYNSVSLRTTYRANMFKNQEGEAQLDDVAITTSEKDIVLELAKQATYEVFSELFKIADGISGSITVPATVTSGSFIIGSILDNAAFNNNVLPAIDSKIENCLRYYIMSEWYSMAGMKEDSTESYAKYKSNLIRMKNLSFQLRKPLMS